jgi:hypothetical protein
MFEWTETAAPVAQWKGLSPRFRGRSSPAVSVGTVPSSRALAPGARDHPASDGARCAGGTDHGPAVALIVTAVSAAAGAAEPHGRPRGAALSARAARLGAPLAHVRVADTVPGPGGAGTRPGRTWREGGGRGAGWTGRARSPGDGPRHLAGACGVGQCALREVGSLHPGCGLVGRVLPVGWAVLPYPWPSSRDAQGGWDGQHGWDLEPVLTRARTAAHVERVVGLWAMGALLL